MYILTDVKFFILFILLENNNNKIQLRPLKDLIGYIK